MEKIAEINSTATGQTQTRVVSKSNESLENHGKVMRLISDASDQPANSKQFLARSFSQRPIGVKIIVKTEFVYTDTLARRHVELVGDWNNWQPIMMRREEKDLWSTVCILPTGYHEFYFLVDGVVTISCKHPKTEDGRHNWRNVYGPRGPLNQKRSAFYKWGSNVLEGFGLVALQSEYYTNTAADMCLPDVGSGGKKNSIMSKLGELGWITTLVAILSTYFVLVAVYTLIFGN